MALENIGEIWQKARMPQRVILLGLGVGLVAAAALLVNWARQPTMALLYSGLSTEEASRIVEKIRDAGVEYELKSGGTAVYVPEGKVYSLRLTMASSGLPSGDNPGYRILDQDTFGSSPFSERVRYNRAVEGEIARSIETLDSVSSARVHVVRPESSLFRKERQRSTATVVLRLKGGYELSNASIAAVVHLVAGSVEGLDPGKVVVVDARGSLLSGESEESFGSRMASVLEQKRQIETYLARKAERHLALVLGPNRATVQVSVEMDTTATQSETRKFGPDKGLPAREMVQESKTSEPPSDKGAAATTSSDSTIETEYKLSETIEKKTQIAGRIQRKTVSVVVDLSDPNSQEATAEGKRLAVADVEEIVTHALGLKLAEAGGSAGGFGGGQESEDSGDILVVKEATFHRPALEAGLAPADEPLLTKDFILEIARRASLGVLVLGALLALRMFRGSGKRAVEASAAPTALEAGGGQAAGALVAAGGGEETDPDQLRAQITRALQDNPEEVKRLFLRWVETEKQEG